MSVSIALAWMLLAGAGVGAQESSTLPQPTDDPPVLKLSLAEAVSAALDKNPNVRLFREKIQAAHAASRTQLGAMLPHISAAGKYNTQTFFFGSIGGEPRRSPEFDIVDGRASFTQSIFSLSLIERWRASRAALQVAELDAVATENDTMNALPSIVRAKDNMIDALFRVNASRVNLARAQGLVETLT